MSKTDKDNKDEADKAKDTPKKSEAKSAKSKSDSAKSSATAKSKSVAKDKPKAKKQAAKNDQEAKSDKAPTDNEPVKEAVVAEGSAEKQTDSNEVEHSSEEKPQIHFEQHHVSKILDEVLEEDIPVGRSFKHPMILDLMLAAGLLIAMGAFTVGMFKMYITHSAEQAITQHNYKAAIAILKGAPFPGFLNFPGTNLDELLSQALYLDAMDKLEVDNDVDGALNELQQIKPGSRFFELAQTIISENFEPSPTLLQGGAQVIEDKPTQPAPAKDNLKDILPEEPKSGSL